MCFHKGWFFVGLHILFEELIDEFDRMKGPDCIFIGGLSLLILVNDLVTFDLDVLVQRHPLWSFLLHPNFKLICYVILSKNMINSYKQKVILIANTFYSQIYYFDEQVRINYHLVKLSNVAILK